MEVRLASNSNQGQSITTAQNQNPRLAPRTQQLPPRSFLVRPAPTQLGSTAPRNSQLGGTPTASSTNKALSEFQSLLAQSLKAPAPGTQVADQSRPSDGAANSVSNAATGSEQTVSEEQLQNGLVEVLLAELSPEALASYQRAFAEAVNAGAGTEDAVKLGLQGAVAEDTVTLAEAESVNGVSFRAAQLDDNLEMLFDHRGSATDQTIAVMPLADALAKAEANMTAISAESAISVSRSLDAPSNGISTATATPNLSNGVSPTQLADTSLAGFLWKPRSESDGNLVILFPSSLTGSVESAAIFGSLPPNSESFIESGRFSNIHNGNRSHFRFSKPGGEYPDGAYVVAQLKDGSSVAIQVGDSSKRNE